MNITEEIIQKHMDCEYDFSQIFPWPGVLVEVDIAKAERLLANGISGGALGFDFRDVILLLKAAIATGNRDFDTCATAFLMPILKEDWRYPHHRHMNQVELGMAVVCNKLALICEQIKEDHQELYTQIARAIIERGLDLFYKQVTDPSKPGWARTFMNWRSFISGKMGMTAKRLYDVYPEWRACLAESIRNCLAVADMGGIDGGWEEGVGYWCMAFGQTVNLAEELLTASRWKVDLFTHSYFRVAGDFGLYCWMPGKKSVYAFSDWRVREPQTDLMHSLACYWQNPHYQWCVECSATPQFSIGKSPPKAEPPDDLPKAKHFRGIDVAILKTGWSDDAIAVGFKCGPRRIQTHHHLDANSFCLIDSGEGVIDEVEHFEDGEDYPQVTSEDVNTLYHLLGYESPDVDDAKLGKASTCAHSTLLIDGTGQLQEKNEWGQFKPTYRAKADQVFDHGEVVPRTKSAHVAGFGEHQWGSYVIGEAADAYPNAIDSFRRTAMLIHPGQLIVADRICASEEVDACWLFHTVGTVKASSQTHLTITAGGVEWSLQAIDCRGRMIKPRVIEWSLQDSSKRYVIANRETISMPYRWTLWHFYKNKADMNSLEISASAPETLQIKSRNKDTISITTRNTQTFKPHSPSDCSLTSSKIPRVSRSTHRGMRHA